MKIGTRFTWTGDDGSDNFPVGERVITKINSGYVSASRPNGSEGLFCAEGRFEELIEEGKVKIVGESKYAVKYVGPLSERDGKNWVNDPGDNVLHEKSGRQIFTTKAAALQARLKRATKVEKPITVYRIVRITPSKLSRAIERVEQIKAQYEASRDNFVDRKDYGTAGMYLQRISATDEILTAIRP